MKKEFLLFFSIFIFFNFSYAKEKSLENFLDQERNKKENINIKKLQNYINEKNYLKNKKCNRNAILNINIIGKRIFFNILQKSDNEDINKIIQDIIRNENGKFFNFFIDSNDIYNIRFVLKCSI